MEYERLSRTCAHALRHQPWVYELELDEEGWAPVSQLLILVVRAAEAYAAGVSFYRGTEHVWLADAVPPEFLER